MGMHASFSMPLRCNMVQNYKLDTYIYYVYNSIQISSISLYIHEQQLSALIALQLVCATYICTCVRMFIKH